MPYDVEEHAAHLQPSTPAAEPAITPESRTWPWASPAWLVGRKVNGEAVRRRPGCAAGLTGPIVVTCGNARRESLDETPAPESPPPCATDSAPPPDPPPAGRAGYAGFSATAR